MAPPPEIDASKIGNVHRVVEVPRSHVQCHWGLVQVAGRRFVARVVRLRPSLKVVAMSAIRALAAISFQADADWSIVHGDDYSDAALGSTRVGLSFSWCWFICRLYGRELLADTRPAGQQHRAKVVDKRVRSQGGWGGGLLHAVVWSEGTNDDGDHV